MNRVFWGPNDLTRTITPPFETSFIVSSNGDEEAHKFDTHEAAVSKYSEIIIGWFGEGIQEIPPMRVLSKGDDIVEIRTPVVPEFLYITKILDGEGTLHRSAHDSVGEALLACAELIYEKLSTGFVDLKPEWGGPTFDAPKSPYEFAEERRDDQSRKYYANGDGEEIGPEFVYWDGSSFDAMFQIDSKLDGWQMRYAADQALLFLNPFVQDALTGPVITFNDEVKGIDIVWTKGEDVLRIIKVKNGVVVADADPHENLKKEGLWTTVDEQYRIERIYNQDEIVKRTWFRLDGTLDEVHVKNADGTTAVETYFPDGISMSAKGMKDSEGERLHWENFPNPKIPADEVVENSDGTTTTTMFYLDGNVRRILT